MMGLGDLNSEESHSFLDDYSDSDSLYSSDEFSEIDENHSLLPDVEARNWELDNVLVGGAVTKPEQAAVPQETSSCAETVETLVWIFSPLLLLVIGIFFTAESVRVSHISCSWKLWLYYLLIGCAFMWMCVTSCMFVAVYKLRENAMPMLSVSSRQLSELFRRHEHPEKPGTVHYTAFRTMVDHLIQINRNQAQPSTITAEFKSFDHYKGGFVPMSEIRANVNRLSRFGLLHLLMQSSVIGTLATLCVALVYGSMYVFSVHKHPCAPHLTHNLRHSLFGLWLLFGGMLSGVVAYFYKLYKPGIEADSANSNFSRLAETA